MTCRPMFSGTLIGVAMIATAAAPGPFTGALGFAALALGVFVAIRFNK